MIYKLVKRVPCLHPSPLPASCPWVLIGKLFYYCILATLHNLSWKNTYYVYSRKPSRMFSFRTSESNIFAPLFIILSMMVSSSSEKPRSFQTKASSLLDTRCEFTSNLRPYTYILWCTFFATSFILVGHHFSAWFQCIAPGIHILCSSITPIIHIIFLETLFKVLPFAYHLPKWSQS